MRGLLRRCSDQLGPSITTRSSHSKPWIEIAKHKAKNLTMDSQNLRILHPPANSWRGPLPGRRCKGRTSADKTEWMQGSRTQDLQAWRPQTADWEYSPAGWWE